jgi:hypothetical protein
MKRESSYRNEKEKKCDYCEKTFYSSHIKEHTDICKKKLKKCIFCKEIYEKDEYIEHLYNCSNETYKKAYKLYTTYDKEFIKLCISKYNERYEHTDIEYDMLTELEKKNIFMINKVKCKSNTYKYYQTVNKINTILCDLVKNL